jgi:hypothetical protein
MPGKQPKKPAEPRHAEPPVRPVRENLTPAEEQLRRDTNWQLDLNEAGEALFGNDRPAKVPSSKVRRSS